MINVILKLNFDMLAYKNYHNFFCQGVTMLKNCKIYFFLILLLNFWIVSAAQIQDLKTDPLPSWNEGPIKTALIEFVKTTSDPSHPHLMLLIHHDDAVREYSYGPDTKVGTFSNALMDEAKKQGWFVVSMKKDWKKIFSFER